MVQEIGSSNFALPTGIDWAKADNDALFDMSLRYANGEGADSNFVVAHIFLNIAASRGCERSAEYRQELAMDTSGKEIAKKHKKLHVSFYSDQNLN